MAKKLHSHLAIYALCALYLCVREREREREREKERRRETEKRERKRKREREREMRFGRVKLVGVLYDN